MPCDKYMELPLWRRMQLENSSREPQTSSLEDIEYSFRVNPKTEKMEYLLPGETVWIPAN